jgi:cadmium resistance protein CadD (predicted permease)
MERLFGAIVVGFTAFVATNLDDIVVLLLFFPQVSDTFRRRHIVGGQYLGFWVLLMLSLPGYQVAAVTVANGGDNLGIYIPLFASNSLPRLTVIVSVFLILVGVWCWIAQRLTQQRAIAQMLSRYGHRVIPFVRMGLGMYILMDGGRQAWVLS